VTRAGLKPCFVCATIGTTSSNVVDPLPDIGRICREHGLWLHVDGAMSGTAALCPEFRHFQQCLELADSYAFNPHKWMFTNFDCDCFYVADRRALIKALSVVPEYLRNQASESGAVIDYRDWQVPWAAGFARSAVVRHPPLRRGRFAASHPAARRAGPRNSPAWPPRNLSSPRPRR
jgi:aromatic-L-amino-acid decarboxylase